MSNPSLAKALVQHNCLRVNAEHGLRMIPLSRVQEVCAAQVSKSEGGGWQVVAELDGGQTVELATFGSEQRDAAEDSAFDWGAQIFGGGR